MKVKTLILTSIFFSFIISSYSQSENDFSIPELMNLGIEKMNEKKYIHAIKYFDEIIKLNPENAEAYIHRGESKIGQGSPTSGKKDIKKGERMKRDKATPGQYIASIFTSISALFGTYFGLR